MKQNYDQTWMENAALLFHANDWEHINFQTKSKRNEGKLTKGTLRLLGMWF